MHRPPPRRSLANALWLLPLLLCGPVAAIAFASRPPATAPAPATTMAVR